MVHDPLHHHLHRAYHLIQAGYHTDALQILAPICRQYPQQPDAWWLAAHALKNPDEVRYALQQVLRINPDYPGAAAKLNRLNAPPPPAWSSPTRSHQASPAGRPASHRTRSAAPPSAFPVWLLLAATTILISISIAAGILLYWQMQDDIPALSDSLTTWVETETAPNSGQPYHAATLPPARGIEIPDGQIPDFSNVDPYQAVATPNPAQFGETYWYGTGDGVTMEHLVIDGRYRRFYQFPVNLYVVAPDSAVWAQAVANAVSQLERVIDIELTTDRTSADIILEILPPDEVQQRCAGLSFTRVVGCASIDYQGGIVAPVIKGYALVATDTNNPTGTVLHELMHAVGVVVHSPNPDDIMYFEETPRIITQLSQRDYNTLRRLYASPSYAD